MASLGREPGGPTHPSAHASVRHARGHRLAVQVETLGRRIQHNAGIVATNVVNLAVQLETLGRRIQLGAGIVATDLKFQQPRLPGRLRTASHGFSASAKTGAGQLTAGKPKWLEPKWLRSPFKGLSKAFKRHFKGLLKAFKRPFKGLEKAF